MFKFALLIAKKDLLILWRNRGALCQPLLLGLILIFIFSLARETGSTASPRESATFFWLSSIFCQMFVLNQLYALEETNLSRQGLLTSTHPVQGVWLGKMLAAFAALLSSQIVFLPAVLIFLNQTPASTFIPGLMAIIFCDLGICAAGSLLCAIANGLASRQSLPTLILFPLLLPLLLAGIAIIGQSLGETDQNPTLWFGIIFAFDCLFIGASMLLFTFIYQGDE